MFSGLRQSSLFYVLEKGEKPVLKVGQVQSVSNPVPKYGQFNPSQPFGQNVETVVDVSVKMGDETLDFKQLPANLQIANFGANGVVVSESREAMLAEVESMISTSKSVLDSVEYHQNVIAECESMLVQLNPQFAKDKEQKEKIGALEEKMSGMENTLSSIQSMLSEALKQSNKQNKN